ncbi:erythromycin esterase family protein [Mangrovivirga sp. M17]|uniref:Erythromycin esterase family protein n=1 Tax=Mangrovivirga halotolerans TaxID=2993936 RepID=A0ABT3RRL0_9BACT|nr:erythromycin esterase family protein [Mangrovivirga halotolerans]MCX2743815.1 erythromycin esterase family protein [Mangrovivirga halotolerans]
MLTNHKKAEEIVNKVNNESHPLESGKDLDPFIEQIGDAKYVLLGEASHGTHEYYTWRTAISKRLIEEKGFNFIAVEGDWPDCYRLNRYVKNYSDSGKSALDVLRGFNRWPTWMWANWEVVALAEWLEKHNKRLAVNKKVGFYGLDVYSLGESLEAILDYLQQEDPKAYDTARKAAFCFEPFGYEGSDYARHTRLVPESCENEVVDLLKEIREKIPQYNTDHETVFSTEQNAHVAVNAEHYYRTMVSAGPKSWNIRDHHMTDTLDRLMNFHGENAKTIVWEHNTHIGDARATDMARHGLINVGQLVTERNPEDDVVKVGFGSYKGSVIAGREWGDVMREMNLPKGKTGSWEAILHQSGANDKLLIMNEWKGDPLFEQQIDHRAVGVVYHPENESYGNYVPTIIPYRYDAFIFIDESRALHPLHIKPDGHEMPETYPWGV